MGQTGDQCGDGVHGHRGPEDRATRIGENRHGAVGVVGHVEVAGSVEGEIGHIAEGGNRRQRSRRDGRAVDRARARRVDRDGAVVGTREDVAMGVDGNSDDARHPGDHGTRSSAAAGVVATVATKGAATHEAATMASAEGCGRSPACGRKGR